VSCIDYIIITDSELLSVVINYNIVYVINIYTDVSYNKEYIEIDSRTDKTSFNIESPKHNIGDER
jgi:hypothetical protein